MKIKAVIFDFDGVIVQTENVKVNRIYQLFMEHGLSVCKSEMSQFFGMSGLQLKETLNGYLKEYNQISIDGIGRVQNFKFILTENTENLLSELKKRGVKCMIASNSSYQRIKSALIECDLDSYFDYIGSAQKIEVYKPNPTIFKICMEHFGLKEHECVIIEDSELGIKCAKKTNSKVIALENNEFELDQSKSDYVIQNLLDVMKVIEEVEQWES